MLFQKLPVGSIVQWSNKLYFGDALKIINDPNLLKYNVIKLYFDGVIAMDGTVNLDSIPNAKKKELWAYLYYLVLTNVTLNIDAANAFRMIQVVKENIGLQEDYYVSKLDLAVTINRVIQDNSLNISNSILDQMVKVYESHLVLKEKDIHEKIGSLNVLNQSSIDEVMERLKDMQAAQEST